MDENYEQLTIEIVAAYVGNNALAARDLPELIRLVYAGLTALTAPALEPKHPTPRVPIRKTITPDHLISLEDGRRYKTLTGHLARHGLTPAQYRTKWRLKSDYPMIAPNYAAQRSELVKAAGFGRKRKQEPAPPLTRKVPAKKQKAGANKD